MWDADADVRWVPYVTVAAVAHLGHTHGGHCQSILRLKDGQISASGAHMWLHCDDDRIPHCCHDLPAGFATGITCIWLCRKTCLDLPTLFEACTTATDQPTADMTVEATENMLALIRSLAPLT